MRPSILLFGDSLTQQAFGHQSDGKFVTRFGWASLLASTYTRRVDVVNRGFSGYNTRHALGILSTSVYPVLEQKNILFCTIFLGANDAALPGSRQHVPVEEYQKNVEEIVSKILETYNGKKRDRDGNASNSSKSLPIILMTPPPVHEPKWKAFCDDTDRTAHARTNINTKMYGKSILSLGQKLNLPVLDAFTLLKGNEDEEKYADYLSDGVHLTEEGQTLIHGELMKLLEKDLSHLMPQDDKSIAGIGLEEKPWTDLC